VSNAPRRRAQYLRCYSEAVTKVTEAPCPPFWHFCHPAGLGIKKLLLQKRRQYLGRSVLLRLGSLCPDSCRAFSQSIFA
jgi:predicted nicotinamide N-methyase